jgi:hypothetical protein
MKLNNKVMVKITHPTHIYTATVRDTKTLTSYLNNNFWLACSVLPGADKQDQCIVNEALYSM